MTSNGLQDRAHHTVFEHYKLLTYREFMYVISYLRTPVTTEEY